MQRTRPISNLLASLQIRQIRWVLVAAFAMTLMDNVRGQGMFWLPVFCPLGE